MSNFEQFTFSKPVLQALVKMNFVEPTPIQEKVIPLALESKDIIGLAQTGTGKTAAYCLPIFEYFLKNKEGGAMVLVPTRELAEQVQDFWRKLTGHLNGMNSVLLIGGAPIYPQMRQLGRNPRLIIATPGRVIDHLNRETLYLDTLKILVLDEADRMLDMGFAPQLEQILPTMPAERHTMLFSATATPMMEKISRGFLTDPERVVVGTESRAALSVKQKAIFVKHMKEKENLLLDQLNEQEGPTLIFTRTQYKTEEIAEYLYDAGHKVSCIHGGLRQSQRRSALASFRKQEIRILVATDIAARGLDVQGVSHVINFDVPLGAEDYIHRIGRTGRAGALGLATSFIGNEDKNSWRYIIKLLQKTGSEMPEEIGESFMKNEMNPRGRFGGGSGRGGPRRFGSSRGGDRDRRGGGGFRREGGGEFKGFGAGNGEGRRDDFRSSGNAENSNRGFSRRPSNSSVENSNVGGGPRSSGNSFRGQGGNSSFGGGAGQSRLW